MSRTSSNLGALTRLSPAAVGPLRRAPCRPAFFFDGVLLAEAPESIRAWSDAEAAAVKGPVSR
jgi:hypothetical protein